MLSCSWFNSQGWSQFRLFPENNDMGGLWVETLSKASVYTKEDPFLPRETFLLPKQN